MKGWKTITLNIIGMILPILENTGMTNLVQTTEFWGIYVIILGVLNNINRIYGTSTKVGKSK